MSASVKPCPWCGENYLAYVFAPDSHRRIAMMCAACGARGPEVMRVSGIAEPISDADREEALRAWNERITGER